MARSHSHGPRIRVTKADAATSVAKNSSHCMIAEAIRKSVPDVDKISVDIQTIRFTRLKENKRYIYLTPRAAQQAIVDFDDGRIPADFSFELMNPQVVPSGRRKTADPAASSRKRNPRTIVGGKAPPMSNLAKRREFGMRNFQARPADEGAQ